MTKHVSARRFLMICLLGSFPAVCITEDNVVVAKGTRDFGGFQSETAPGKASEITFKSVQMGDGFTSDGSRMYYTKYQSSDGKVLYETWIYFDSTSKAAKKIQDLLTRPVRNLRESPEINKNGQEVGKRVVVLRQEGAESGTEAILAWTNGPRYQELRSSSLEVVLAFEKQYRPPTKQEEHGRSSSSSPYRLLNK